MRTILKSASILMWFVLVSIDFLHAQHVGIGTATPTQQLDVNGGLRVGGTNIANPGAIRWNETKNDFEGYNGIAWVSLTGGKGKWGDQSSYSNESTASAFNLNYGNILGSELGNAMAGQGDWIVAGAYKDASIYEITKWATGSIRMMKRKGDQWNLKHSIFDFDDATNDFFGYSVGISPTHVVSGTPYADMPGVPDQGKAYIYTYDTIGSAYQTTLLASDAQYSDHFGAAVGISGDFVTVGAPENDILAADNMGRAYIYNRSGTAWPEIQVLTPSDGVTNDRYGTAIAFWGEYLAISSPFKAFSGFTDAGKVYVYRKNGATWSLIQQLNSPTPNKGERFGTKIALKENILLVGAPDYMGSVFDGKGSVYIYEINNNTVSYQSAIQASDGVIADAFGAAVDYLNGVIMVGAPYANVGGSPKHGKAYVFKEINGTWQQEAILSASTDEHNIQFGTSVALVPGFGAVGAPFAYYSIWPDNGQLFFFKQY